MKKTILLLLTAMIVFSCQHCLAEDFVLRNGILFGDSFDTIKQKETLTFYSEEDDKSELQYKGKIAGIDGRVFYYFDIETGKLTDMLYKFDSESSKDPIDADYSTLYSSLVRKYGTPLGNTGGSLNIITGKAIESGAGYIGFYKYLLNGDGNYRDYDEWIVETDDGSVKIDLFSFYVRSKDYDYYFYNYLSYHYFTIDDLANALQEKIDENTAIDNDL